MRHMDPLTFLTGVPLRRITATDLCYCLVFCAVKVLTSVLAFRLDSRETSIDGRSLAVYFLRRSSTHGCVCMVCSVIALPAVSPRRRVA
jgi:hypothetical protein